MLARNQCRLSGLVGCWILLGSPVAAGEHENISATKTNLVIDLGGEVRMEFVAIEAGSFTMGSAQTELMDQKPAHVVTIEQPYYLGKYEVTQEQWQAIMGEAPSIYKGPRYPDSGRYPVENVSWIYCQQFLDKLNPKISGYEVRLPTEAEWEYACRAGTMTEFSLGDAAACGEFAWFGPNAGGQTRPVGQKKPNAWGLCDMHGNVWEWCSDIYQAYPGGSLPSGVGTGTSRVLRGGAFNSMAERLTSSYRHELEPGDAARYYGFRCVAVSKPVSK